MDPRDADLGSTAQAIIDGTPTAGSDAAVVALLRSGSPYCTGTLVASRVVLTAGHCAPVGREPEAVFFGDEVALGGVTIDVRSVERHPTFVDGPTPVDDVAVLALASRAPAETQPIPLRTDALDGAIDAGRAARIVGFGHTSPGGDTGVKHTASATIASVAFETFTLDPEGPRPCVGDSGGPSFVANDGVEQLAGVHSFGDDGCASIALDARVDVYAEPFLLGAIARLDGSHDDGGCTIAHAAVGTRTVGPSAVALGVALLALGLVITRALRRDPHGDTRDA